MALEFAAYEYDTRDPQSFSEGETFYDASGKPLSRHNGLPMASPAPSSVSCYDINGWLLHYSLYHSAQAQGVFIREVPVGGTPCVYPYMRSALADGVEYALIVSEEGRSHRYIFSGAPAFAHDFFLLPAADVIAQMPGWQQMAVRTNADYASVTYPAPIRRLQADFSSPHITAISGGKQAPQLVSHIFLQRRR
jgi:hypothetical protein